MDTRTTIIMVRWIICAMIANVLGSGCAPVFGITSNATMTAINKQELGTSHIWWYADILPFRFGTTPFLFTSLVPQLMGTKLEQPGIALRSVPLDFTVWQVNDGRTSQLAVMYVGNFDYAKIVPQVVALPDDLYLFFFIRQQDIQPFTPVLRCSAGGWCWQTLDTVETQIRQLVAFTDVVQGKVFDGTGECIADINKVKKWLKDSDQLVSFKSSIDTGLLGKSVAFDKVRPPLPYECLYFYFTTANHEPSVIQLSVAKDTEVKYPDKPTLSNKAVPGPDDIVTFGKPVADGQRVFYWYCIQQKDKPTYRVYILAYHDGKQAVAIDGYIVNPPNVRYWRENAWVKEERILEWDYQQQLGFPVQPIVGKDADGKIISYRPPELYRLEFIPDADKAQQKDLPAGIPIK